MWLSPNQKCVWHSQVSDMRFDAINRYIYLNRERNDLDAIKIVVDTFMNHPNISIQFDENMIPTSIVRV